MQSSRHTESANHAGSQPTKKRSTVQVPANFDVGTSEAANSEDPTDLPRQHVSRWVLQMSASRPQTDAQTSETGPEATLTRFRKPVAWTLLLGGAGAAAYLLATRTRLSKIWG